MLIDADMIARVQQNQPNIRYRDRLLTAAISIVLRDTDNGTEFLMMQRAFHDDDPWSGQMSFPGGKLEPDDENHKAAAIRETFEEVGLTLTDNDYVGRLDDVYGLKENGVFTVHVACFVFKTSRPLTLLANHEVADLVWIPFSHLDEKANSVNYYHPHNASLKMPALLINAKKDQILWGLSLRILVILTDVLGCSMNALSCDEKEQMKHIEKLDFRENDDVGGE